MMVFTPGMFLNSVVGLFIARQSLKTRFLETLMTPKALNFMGLHIKCQPFEKTFSYVKYMLDLRCLTDMLAIYALEANDRRGDGRLGGQ